MRAIIATEAYYHNEPFYARTLGFFGKFAAILKKNMVGDGYFELPLPEQQPPAWSNFYECFIEDFIEFAIFISRQVQSGLGNLSSKNRHTDRFSIQSTQLSLDRL